MNEIEEFSDLKILALIPAYNEGPRVAAVALGAAEYLPVLVVDDGSGDDSAEQARLAGVEVLAQSPNQGKGAALRMGFAWALEHGYQAVITLDADGQHDPHEIPAFLAAFASSHADLIIGRRDFGQMPAVRRMSNSVGRRVFSWAVRAEIADNQSGYRLIGRELMQQMLTPAEHGFEFEVEMIVTCLLRGMQLAWVPIRTIYGDEGSHIRPLRHAARFFQVSLLARRALRQQRRE